MPRGPPAAAVRDRALARLGTRTEDTRTARPPPARDGAGGRADRAPAFHTEGPGPEKQLDFPAPDGRFLTVAEGRITGIRSVVDPAELASIRLPAPD